MPMNFEERKKMRQQNLRDFLAKGGKHANLFKEVMEAKHNKKLAELTIEQKEALDEAHQKVFGFRIDKSCPNCFYDALNVLYLIWLAIQKVGELVDKIKDAVKDGKKDKQGKK